MLVAHDAKEFDRSPAHRPATERAGDGAEPPRRTLVLITSLNRLCRSPEDGGHVPGLPGRVIPLQEAVKLVDEETDDQRCRLAAVHDSEAIRDHEGLTRKLQVMALSICAAPRQGFEPANIEALPANATRRTGEHHRGGIGGYRQPRTDPAPYGRTWHRSRRSRGQNGPKWSQQARSRTSHNWIDPTSNPTVGGSNPSGARY